MTLNYGGRYDRFDSTFDTEDQFSPRANLVYKLDKATTAHIGYAPRDSSAPFAAQIERDTPPGDPSDPAVIYQGGAFVKQGPSR